VQVVSGLAEERRDVAGGFPIPSAKESSTVEWQRAHRSPIEARFPWLSNNPVTPTTEFSEKGERGRGVVEVDLAVLDSPLQWGGQGVRIHLEADRQRGLGAHAVADTSVLRAGDGSVKLEGLAPKGFAAEGVEAKNSPAILERLPRVVGDGWVDRRRRFATLTRGLF